MVDRPLIVIGTGRCGTTLVFEVLAAHPQVTWLSAALVEGREPLHDQVARRLGFRVGPWFQPKGEAYAFWTRFDPPFFSRGVEPSEEHVPAGMAQAVHAEITRQQRITGRRRFVTKLTGWSPIRYFDAIFPDARYLHVVRDGRAVAWSLLNVDWWDGFHGPNPWGKSPDKMSPAERETWEQSGRSRYILAGLQWQRFMEGLTRHGAQIGDRYRELRYERLVAQPVESFREVLGWADLSRDQGFLEGIANREFHDGNRQWRERVPQADQRQFENLLGDALRKYAYG